LEAQASAPPLKGSLWAPFLFFRLGSVHRFKEAQLKRFLLDDRGDMVERGLIMAAIVVAAVFLWVSIGQKLAAKLNIVDASIGG
jgi:Flp pilus assembly pilin Flp